VVKSAFKKSFAKLRKLSSFFFFIFKTFIFLKFFSTFLSKFSKIFLNFFHFNSLNKLSSKISFSKLKIFFSFLSTFSHQKNKKLTKKIADIFIKRFFKRFIFICKIFYIIFK
jgi:hypothetical protein